MIKKDYQEIKGCLKNSLIALTFAGLILNEGCATPQSNSQKKAKQISSSDVPRFFATYTWGAQNESYCTNVLRADNPLGLMYLAHPDDYSDISEKLHFRILRDDPYDAVGYYLEEIIIRPENLSSSTNNLGEVVYSYSFERAGIVSKETLGPARRYLCVAEYWADGKDPRRIKAREFFYIVPGVNIFFIWLDLFINPILMQQSIRIID